MWPTCIYNLLLESKSQSCWVLINQNVIQYDVKLLNTGLNVYGVYTAFTLVKPGSEIWLIFCPGNVFVSAHAVYGMC